MIELLRENDATMNEGYMDRIENEGLTRQTLTESELARVVRSETVEREATVLLLDEEDDPRRAPYAGLLAKRRLSGPTWLLVQVGELLSGDDVPDSFLDEGIRTLAFNDRFGEPVRATSRATKYDFDKMDPAIAEIVWMIAAWARVGRR